MASRRSSGYFDLDRDLPLTLGLLVDTSESQRKAIADERAASGTFLDQMLTGKQGSGVCDAVRS